MRTSFECEENEWERNMNYEDYHNFFFLFLFKISKNFSCISFPCSFHFMWSKNILHHHKINKISSKTNVRLRIRKHNRRQRPRSSHEKEGKLNFAFNLLLLKLEWLECVNAWVESFKQLLFRKFARYIKVLNAHTQTGEAKCLIKKYFYNWNLFLLYLRFNSKIECRCVWRGRGRSMVLCTQQHSQWIKQLKTVIDSILSAFTITSLYFLLC